MSSSEHCFDFAGLTIYKELPFPCKIGVDAVFSQFRELRYSGFEAKTRQEVVSLLGDITNLSDRFIKRLRSYSKNLAINQLQEMIVKQAARCGRQEATALTYWDARHQIIDSLSQRAKDFDLEKCPVEFRNAFFDRINYAADLLSPAAMFETVSDKIDMANPFLYLIEVYKMGAVGVGIGQIILDNEQQGEEGLIADFALKEGRIACAALSKKAVGRRCMNFHGWDDDCFSAQRKLSTVID